MPYRYIFKVTVRKGEEARFIEHWQGGSVPIQQHLGALGTRLHHVLGEENVFIAIAEWKSKRARDEAFASLAQPGSPLSEEYRKWAENEEFGEVTLIAEAEEVSAVVLPKLRKKISTLESNIAAEEWAVILATKLPKRLLAELDRLSRGLKHIRFRQGEGSLLSSWNMALAVSNLPYRLRTPDWGGGFSKKRYTLVKE